MKDEFLVTPYYDEPLTFTDKTGNKHYGKYVRNHFDDSNGNYKDSYTNEEYAVIDSWDYI